MADYRIFDQRKTDGGRSKPNRERLLRREEKTIKDRIRDSLMRGKLDEIGNAESRKIRISGKGMRQPAFSFSGKGIYEHVLPGNKEFSKGDKLPRPPQGGSGRGNEGSRDGEGEDDYVFEMSEEAYLGYLLDDLKLPDMVKKRLTGSEEKERVRAGYSKEGPLSRAHLPISISQARIRRKAARLPRERRIRELEQERVDLEEVLSSEPHAPHDDPRRMRILEIEQEIEGQRRKIRALPFLDPVDMRYRDYTEEPKPVANAAVFYILDASASMTEPMKEMAKIFFWLMNRFLTRTYKNVVVVFIRHTSTAREVDEETFFGSTETGGTVISTAYETMLEIIDGRFPLEEWNIYACQSSDGDNVHDDMPRSVQLLSQHILPIVQYMAYVEVGSGNEYGGRTQTPMMLHLTPLAGVNPGVLALARVNSKEDIYPVFRGLFEREGEKS